MKTKLLLVILLLLHTNISFSQWSTDPSQNTPICTEPGNQCNPHVVVDEKGNSIIVWEDQTINIYAQRLNRYGYKTWDNRGVPICTKWRELEISEVIYDGYGGAIIVWLEYVGDDMFPPTDIYAQRIDSTGALLWDFGGVAVCTAEDNQLNASAVPDNEGGAIIVWQDSRPGPNGIYVQRINKFGETVWVTNGLDLNDPKAAGSKPNIVINGFSGALVTYNGPGPNFQNINSHGEFMCPVDSMLYNYVPLAEKEMISDGAKGFIVVGKTINNFTYDIRIQRVNCYGELLWSPYGTIITEIADDYSGPEMATDQQSGAFIAWTVDTTITTTNRQLYLSRVDSSGKTGWIKTFTDSSLRKSTISGYNIIEDGKGSAIFKFTKHLSDTIQYQYLQKIDIDGNYIWGNNGVIFTTRPDFWTYGSMACDNFGGAIIVWEEFPFDIYAQQVSLNGNLGEVITYTSHKKQENKTQHYLLLENYPNPFNTSTQISYQLPEGGDVSLKIYNLNGQIVKTLINQKQKEGGYDITWNGKDENNNQVTSGIYLVELLSQRFRTIKKITLLR